MAAYKTVGDGVDVTVTEVDPISKGTYPKAVRDQMAAVGIPTNESVQEKIYLIKFPDGTVKSCHERSFSANFRKVG